MSRETQVTTHGGRLPAVAIFSVGLLIVWIVTIVAVAPSELRRFFGGGLLSLGLLLLVFHRSMGAQAFAGARKFTRMWDRAGELGSQRLYLIFGALLFLGGTVLLMLSVVHVAV